MAGIENIKDRIINDAEVKKQEIKINTSKHIEEIQLNSKKHAEIKIEEIEKKTQHEIAEKRRIINSMTELEMRKNLLHTKQMVIEEVFNEALNHLSNMNDEEYFNIIYKLVIASISSGDEEIVFSQKDKNKFGESLVQKVNSHLISIGKTANIRLSDDSVNICGGFIIRSSGIEINNSFEAILRMKRDEIEPKVAELLFK